jgi:hypothetical protein
MGLTVSQTFRAMQYGEVDHLEGQNPHKLFTVQHRGKGLKLLGNHRLARNLLKKWGQFLLRSNNIRQRQKGRKLVLLSYELKFAMHLRNKQHLMAKSRRPGVHAGKTQKYALQMETERNLRVQALAERTKVLASTSLAEAKLAAKEALKRYQPALQQMMDIASGSTPSQGKTSAFRRAEQAINNCLETITVLHGYHPDETKDLLRQLAFYARVCHEAQLPAKGERSVVDLAGYALTDFTRQVRAGGQVTMKALLQAHASALLTEQPQSIASLQARIAAGDESAVVDLAQINTEVSRCRLALQRQLYREPMPKETDLSLLINQKHQQAPLLLLVEQLIDLEQQTTPLRTANSRSTVPASPVLQVATSGESEFPPPPPAEELAQLASAAEAEADAAAAAASSENAWLLSE